MWWHNFFQNLNKQIARRPFMNMVYANCQDAECKPKKRQRETETKVFSIFSISDVVIKEPVEEPYS